MCSTPNHDIVQTSVSIANHTDSALYAERFLPAHAWVMKYPPVLPPERPEGPPAANASDSALRYLASRCSLKPVDFNKLDNQSPILAQTSDSDSTYAALTI